jgi:uncharacterized protein (TIGR02996 family)
MAKRKSSRATLRKALEESLIADPDDVASHAAYSDHLMESPDPGDQARGEFIRVQLALEDESLHPEERQKLRAREEELLAAHQAEWLGGLAPFLLASQAQVYGQNEFCFRRGWLDRLPLAGLSIPMARALSRAPEATLLRHLEMEWSGAREQGFVPQPGDNMHLVAAHDHEVGLCPLIGSPYLGNVIRFRYGHDPGDDWRNHNGRCWCNALGAVLRQFPRLEELYLFAEGFSNAELFSQPFTRLRVVQIYQTSQVLRLDLLAANPAFSSSTHLRFHPHCMEDLSPAEEQAGFNPEEGYLPLRVVSPLLHSPHLENLEHLQLRLSSIGDDGCREIVSSGILKRLKVLDLRHGRITDEGARILADCPDIRHLERLDLDRNQLTARGQALLAALGLPQLQVDDQLTAAEAYQYLYEGDGE